MFCRQVTTKKGNLPFARKTVLLQQSNNNLNSSETAMEPDIPVKEDSTFHETVENYDLYTAYAQRKLRLAENWTDKLYSTIISGNALQGAQCFSCQNFVFYVLAVLLTAP